MILCGGAKTMDKGQGTGHKGQGTRNKAPDDLGNAGEKMKLKISRRE